MLYNHIDLFAGCGGLSLGLHKAGWNGLFAIEKSSDAFKTLSHNLISKEEAFTWPSWLEKSELDINDVLEKHENELQKLKGSVDLVTGGPPCQGFSLAGKRNEDDARNQLFKSYIKFIDLVEPKLIFFENVKGFDVSFKGKKGEKYSDILIKTLADKYDVHSALIDFSEYGVPQKRTRFILVGVLKSVLKDTETNAQTFFEVLEANKIEFLKAKGLKAKTSLGDAISDLLKKNGTKVSPDSKNFKAGKYGKAKSAYQLLMRDAVTTNGSPVDSHRFANHSDPIIERFKAAIKEQLAPLAYRERFELKKSGTKLLQADTQTPTLTTLPDDYIHYCEPRILTVREYARIQSFPDDFLFKGKYTTGGKLRVLEVPRYTQIGNAIPPLFAEQCGLALKTLLNYEQHK